MRAKRVDADIRVAGMDEDLLVLLEPRVECVPVEAGRAGHPVDRVVAEDPHGARAVRAAHPEAVAAGRALAEALLVVFVDEEALVDVVDRDVVLRVVRPFPDIPRPGGVEDLPAAEHPAHAPRCRFAVIGLRDHLRIVAFNVPGSRFSSHHKVLPPWTQFSPYCASVAAGVTSVRRDATGRAAYVRPYPRPGLLVM